MCKQLTRTWLPVAIMLIAVAGVDSQSGRESALQNPAPEATSLKAEEKAAVAEVLRLQAELGEQLWPGYGRARIPIIIYNERHEFLIGADGPPAPWTAVEGDDFGGKTYHRRTAAKPQAFAVRVGNGWAGSMSSLEMLNRKAPLKMGREYYLMLVHHEMFHAFEASQAPERFRQALKVYAAEDRYPAGDKEFAAAWDKEGSLLAAALKAGEGVSVRSTVREFLETRDARRAKAGLGADLLAYERELEWLEGLTKYVEIGLYDLAAARSGQPSYSTYRPAAPYWRVAEFYRLEKLLSRQEGDGRFYSSGMAQARLLDALAPGWKEKVMRPGTFLEDLLRAAIEPM